MNAFIVLLLILSSFGIVSAQKSCLPGTIRVGKKACTACPPGTFSNNFNAIRCKPCPVATFQAREGAQSEDQCIPCAAGTFSDKERAARCTPCPKGEDSLPGSQKCGFCPAGLSLSRRYGCTRCLRAFFTDKPGSKVCKRCPDGTFTGGGNAAFPFSGFGATSCQKCPPGTYRRNSKFDFNPVSVFLNNKCLECQKGTFNDVAGSRSCKLCPLGTFSQKGATKCSPCPIGTFNNRIPGTRCKKCPTGQTTAGSGAAGCKNVDGSCAFNTFEGSDSICKACMPGEYFDAKRKTCVPCGPKEFSNGGVDAECKRCPGLKVPLGDLNMKENAGCNCPVGFIDDGTDCVACPPGTYWVNGYHFFRTTDGFARVGADDVAIEGECKACEVGTFSDKSAMQSCKPCPVDTFQDREGGSKCMKCPPGSRSPRLNDPSTDTNRGKCLVEETGCKAGEIRNRRGECEAVSCPSKNTFLKKNECLSCEKGFVATKRKGCVTCRGNETSLGGASKVCTKCLNGKRQNFNGVCECPQIESKGKCVSECPPGTGRDLVGSGTLLDETTVICLKCPPRTVSSSFDRCEECGPKGISPDGIKCVACPTGQVVEIDLFGIRLNRCRQRNL